VLSCLVIWGREGVNFCKDSKKGRSKHRSILRECYIQSMCVIYFLLGSGVKPLPCNREGERWLGFQYTVFSVIVLEIGVISS